MVRAKKQLGQHFLHHKAILERIADAVELRPGARVLEIGPGQGALTAALATRGARITAIEKDRELAVLVRDRLPAVHVVTGDALELDWRATAGAAPGEPLFVVGNIPYQITSPLIARALETRDVARVVFLVQEEVADRLQAPPGSEAYGALSVGVQSVARVEKLFKVPAGAFHPRPDVGSALIRLTPLPEPLIPPGQVPVFRRLVVGLFSFRRKQLGRGLRELLGWPAVKVEAVLRELAIDVKARPETLSPEQFVALLRVTEPLSR